jgi:ankyrin repeat protein
MESTDSLGRTPLFYAVAKDDIHRIHTQVADSANVNARDHHGETPLHAAAREFKIAAATILLAEGANPNAQDNEGNTPLFRAVFDSRGRGEMIRQLLAAGADKRIINHYGISPEKLAMTIANYDVAKFFR